MPKSKTYDPDRAPKGAQPDGLDNGSNGPVDLAGDGPAVPYWYVDDDQGELNDDGTPRQLDEAHDAG